MTERQEQRIKEIMNRYSREVCLRYPTYTTWKYARDVSLKESDIYPVIAERWGNSEEGYVINSFDKKK